WGRARMLLLYLVAAVAGSCFAVWLDQSPTGQVPTVGASGALCGLLGSFAVWVLLHRDELGSATAASVSQRLLINFMIIAFISFYFDNVSWQGHLGGALGGALASFPLQWSRYGNTLLQRILGGVGPLFVAALFVA